MKLAATLTLAAASLAWAQPQVRVKSGLLEGRDDHGIRVFRGIPFARPPVGPLRWRPPVPAEPWVGTRAALESPASCIQPSRIQPQSEDCLYLNIWAPEPAKKAPVMVWLHGGGYRTGSGSLPLYDGSAFARRGAVLVTVNYRLGLLGYMAHPGLSRESPQRVSGNYGLLDQIEALRWVRESIAGFGGDPQNVTVFGESAGAGSVSCLLFSPLAKGLFQKAILESGVLDDQLRDLRTPHGGTDSAEHQGVEIARASACSGNGSIACMRAMRPQVLLKMVNTISCLDCTQRDTLGPIVDGYAVPGQPYDLLQAGKWNPVPLIAGSNRGEGSIVLGIRPMPSPEGYRVWLTSRFHDHAPKILAAYPAASHDEVRTALQDIYTDTWYRCPAESLSAAAREAYVYRFSRVPAGMESRTTHGMELPFVFESMGNRDPLAGRMNEAWYRFAATGNPGEDWTRFDAKSGSRMEFGEQVHTGRTDKLCEVWRFPGHTAGIPGGSF